MQQDLEQKESKDVPEDPVGDVQGSVDSKRSKVVRRDRLCLSRPLEHEQLGEGGDRLEVNGEGPEDLGWRVGIRDEDR